MAGLHVQGFGWSFIFFPKKFVHFAGRPIVRFQSKRCNIPSVPLATKSMEPARNSLGVLWK
eukprot:1500722-Amphidinium_carterae.1